MVTRNLTYTIPVLQQAPYPIKTIIHIDIMLCYNARSRYVRCCLKLGFQQISLIYAYTRLRYAAVSHKILTVSVNACHRQRTAKTLSCERHAGLGRTPVGRGRRGDLAVCGLWAEQCVHSQTDMRHSTHTHTHTIAAAYVSAPYRVEVRGTP